MNNVKDGIGVVVDNSDLMVEKVDDVHMRVWCDRGIAYQLNQFFSFEVPGAQFMPTVRNKMWDGKIRLFSIREGTLYVGLLHILKEFAKMNDYSIGYINVVEELNTVTSKVVEDFINSLKLPHKVDEHQMKCVIKALTGKRMLILSPTASGKSLIIYILVRILLKGLSKGKILIIVPTTTLVEQMYSDFKEYAKKEKWNTAKMCHRIYQGKEKDTDKQIVITTWQSIYRKRGKWWDQFNCMFGDEVHHFQAKSLTAIATKLKVCPYKFGLTGSLDESLCHKLVLEGLFGPVYRAVTTTQLQKEGRLANLKIKCVILDYDDETKKMGSKLKYQDELKFLFEHEKRNKFLHGLALTLKGNTLILYSRIAHGETLFKMIEESKEEDQKVWFIYGKTPTEDRNNIRGITEKETNAIIVASFGTFSTGINIKNLHNIIFAAPFKSRIRNLQSVGRGLRLGNRKSIANLYDISDKLVWKSKTNTTFNHFIKRAKVYDSERFEYEITNIFLA
jgi:superfamily II DNA or RNA helicase